MSTTKWHNPENVSADLLPEGYRFLTKEEFRYNTNGWKLSRRALLWWHGWVGPSVWDGNSENTYCAPIAAMPPLAEEQPPTEKHKAEWAWSAFDVFKGAADDGMVLVDAKELAELREDRARLDWLTAKGPWDQWMHVETKEQLTLRGEIRAAIDAARAARKEAAK